MLQVLRPGILESLQEKCQTYWDMVEVGDVLARELTITPELCPPLRGCR